MVRYSACVNLLRSSEFKKQKNLTTTQANLYKNTGDNSIDIESAVFQYNEQEEDNSLFFKEQQQLRFDSENDPSGTSSQNFALQR